MIEVNRGRGFDLHQSISIDGLEVWYIDAFHATCTSLAFSAPGEGEQSSKSGDELHLADLSQP